MFPGKDEGIGKFLGGLFVVLFSFALAIPTAGVSLGMTPQVAAMTSVALSGIYLAGKAQEKA